MSKKKLHLEPAESMELIIRNKGELVFEKEIIGFIQGKVSEFGNSAKINFTKDYFNNKVYVVVCK